MAIVGVHHIQLAMSIGEETRAVAFYQGLLGIPQVDKPAQLAVRGGCWFETELIRIHLGVEEDFKPAGKAHPALLVNGLSVMQRHLEDAGVEIVVDEPLPGFQRFYLYDPFGNRLELLEPLS